MQASLQIKRLGPELGIWHKIGYTRCILFIASLWLAKLIILPNQSPWTMKIVNANFSIWNLAYKTCNTFVSLNRLIFLNVYIPIMEFFFCFIPTTCITTFFYLASCIFCFMNGCIWWIPFIKIWWHLLSQNGRSIFDTLFDSNPDYRSENTPQVF